MDTIPPGQRLIIRAPGTTGTLKHSRPCEAANLLAEITRLTAIYNARLRRMSLTDRASYNLTSLQVATRLDGLVSIVHHDSPSWAVSIVAAPIKSPGRVTSGWYQRPIHPADRAQLRAYFLRKGGSKADAWRRFPPADSAETAQMAHDLKIKLPKATDPMDKIIRAAARKRGANPDDPAFQAKIRAEQAELSALLDSVVV